MPSVNVRGFVSTDRTSVSTVYVFHVFCFFLHPAEPVQSGIPPSIYTFTRDVCAIVRASARAAKRRPGLLAHAHAHSISFARVECEKFKILSLSLTVILTFFAFTLVNTHPRTLSFF